MDPTREALQTRSCSGLDSWIVHVWKVFDSWIVPVWSLKNEELFLIRLGIVHAWEVFDSWIVHAWEVFDSWIVPA